MTRTRRAKVAVSPHFSLSRNRLVEYAFDLTGPLVEKRSDPTKNERDVCSVDYPHVTMGASRRARARVHSLTLGAMRGLQPSATPRQKRSPRLRNRRRASLLHVEKRKEDSFP